MHQPIPHWISANFIRTAVGDWTFWYSSDVCIAFHNSAVDALTVRDYDTSLPANDPHRGHTDLIDGGSQIKARMDSRYDEASFATKLATVLAL